MIRPRLGFVGVGWIGRHRLDAIHRAGIAEIVVVADAVTSAAHDAARDVDAAVAAPEAVLDGSLGLDGVVIATPNAAHADQARAAFATGAAVFCQKPLGRNAPECRTVVEAARAADRLLGVDLSYRHVAAVQRMRDEVASGAIGDVYAADLVFHNAYGPDKPWFTNPALSGGGCVIDLGIHLVDLALWVLAAGGDGRDKVEEIHSRLFANGRLLGRDPSEVEDHAVAQLALASGRVINVACSWFLHAGRDAVIGANLHGTAGALELTNLGGSFYDFRLARHHRTTSDVLAEPPDDWGGRAAVDWTRRLAGGERFDPANDELVEVAVVLDGMYGR